MNSRVSFVIPWIILILILSCTRTVFGQAVSGIDLTPSIEDPRPGQSVTITARSYSTDINAATIVWSSAGRTLKQGTGVTTLTVTAPAMGKTLQIDITAVSPDGLTFENSIVLSSGSVDLIVEPQAYAVPWFSGKLPVAYQNTVKVVAMPHLANAAGVEFDPKTLVYKWEQGSAVLQSQSGYGRQSVIITGSLIPRPSQVTVTVSTRDGSAVTSQSILITPVPPSIVFYRNDPLYGPLYNAAVKNNVYLGTAGEINILAALLGFNMPASGLGDLGMKWMVNNTLRPELAQNLSITLRAPSGASGTSNIILTASNSNEFLQSATAGFQAVFSSTGTSSSSIAF